VALALHHAYTGIEAILLRVARALEGEEPSGPDWHKELLEEMALNLPDVRPAILSAETIAALRLLLAFRHFFRHAYTTELSPARLSDVREAASDARTPLAADLDALDRLLAKIAAQP
jgi:hypothetical protein